MKPEGGFGGASFALPSPVVTRAIVGLCIAAQAAASLGGAHVVAALAEGTLVPGRVTGHLPAGGVPPVLTLVTSLFLHAGWIHLLINMTFLLWVGRHVELVAGRWRFALWYMVGGVAGGVLQVVVEPGSSEQVVGASGAIAAIFGAYAVMFARNRVSARQVFGVRVSGEAVTALWYLLTWVGLQLLTAVAFNTGTGILGGGIAVWTHVGGFAVGLVAAQPVARRLRQLG